MLYWSSVPPKIFSIFFLVPRLLSLRRYPGFLTQLEIKISLKAGCSAFQCWL